MNGMDGRHVRAWQLAGLLIAVLAGVAWADRPDAEGAPASHPGASRPAASSPADTNTPPGQCVVTHHKMTLAGATISYTATAGTLQTTGPDGKAQADIFFVAYTRDGADLPRRPVTFAFNGGPGASSVYLHMGALGPKRAVLGEGGLTLPRRFETVDNEYTWLGFTDLVFVDPVGTGYSRPAPGVPAKDFYGLQTDVDSLGDFIRLYVTQNDRWLSPKYLAGESYGTTRAVGLAGHLQEHCGMYINGLVLLSSALNFQVIGFAPGNDLPYALCLPSYTATAWYHKKLPPDLQADLPKTLAQVEHWALTEYATALAQGDALSAADRKKVLQDLARFTGLDEDFIDRSRLRINNRDFCQELLRKERQVVGLYDGRVAGSGFDLEGQSVLEDPALSLVIGPFVATMQDYVRQVLGYRTNWPYEFLSGEVSRVWDWNSGGRGMGGFVNVSRTLQQAMNSNTNLRVLSCSGYYDLVTGYFAQQYTLNHVGLDEPIRRNIRYEYYDAGHQVYTFLPSLKKLQEDVASFIQPPPSTTQPAGKP